jgi:hypothetical protein
MPIDDVAFAEIVAVPLTVPPFVGAVIDTEGGGELLASVLAVAAED